MPEQGVEGEGGIATYMRRPWAELSSVFQKLEDEHASNYLHRMM
jgi:hypothetical protein